MKIPRTKWRTRDVRDVSFDFVDVYHFHTGAVGSQEVYGHSASVVSNTVWVLGGKNQAGKRISVSLSRSSTAAMGCQWPGVLTNHSDVINKHLWQCFGYQETKCYWNFGEYDCGTSKGHHVHVPSVRECQGRFSQRCFCMNPLCHVKQGAFTIPLFEEPFWISLFGGSKSWHFFFKHVHTKIPRATLRSRCTMM